MDIWKKIRRISFFKLIQFGWIFLQKPRLIFPVWNATKETLKICNSLYGNAHQGRGKANAFRHACWNFQICEKSFKIIKNRTKSAKWAQKVVDLYEKVTKNDLLDQQMDFHNNEFGRNYFIQKTANFEQDSIDFLEKEAEKAQKVSNMADFEKFKGQLVYITE